MDDYQASKELYEIKNIKKLIAWPCKSWSILFCLYYKVRLSFPYLIIIRSIVSLHISVKSVS
jgi:hypothetical protein